MDARDWNRQWPGVVCDFCALSSQPPVALKVVHAILGNIQNSLTEVSTETQDETRAII